jgi:hypothetical protein
MMRKPLKQAVVTVRNTLAQNLLKVKSNIQEVYRNGVTHCYTVRPAVAATEQEEGL